MSVCFWSFDPSDDMTKHWVLHLSLDPVQVHEILEPFIMFYNLVGTEDDILIDLAMFLHYPGIIGLSLGDITSRA